MCEVIGRPELATDPRFADHASLLAHSARRDRDPDARCSPSAPSTSGASGSPDFVGQWTVVQDTLEAAADPQIGRQRLRAGLRDRRRRPVPARRPRRCSSTRSPRCRGARRSSTSTATPSSPSSDSTGTPSSTSRCAASSPDHREEHGDRAGRPHRHRHRGQREHRAGDLPRVRGGGSQRGDRRPRRGPGKAGPRTGGRARRQGHVLVLGRRHRPCARARRWSRR